MGLCPGQSPVSAARRLQGLRKVAIDELGNVERDLQREASEDSELRERHRAAWRRPASAALNAKFLEKVAGEPRPRCMCSSPAFSMHGGIGARWGVRQLRFGACAIRLCRRQAVCCVASRCLPRALSEAGPSA